MPSDQALCVRRIEDETPRVRGDLSLVYPGEPGFERGRLMTPAVAAPMRAMLEAEIVQMEDALAIFRRHAALKRECAALCIELPPLTRSMEMIATTVAYMNGLKLADLIGPDRRRCIAHPRQEAMYALYEERLTDGRRRWSLPQIGEFLGGRDHTSVLHGIRALARRRGLPL